MKKMTKFFALAFVMLAFAATTFAQTTAVARATIITPLTMVNTLPLNFGNVVGTAAGGTVLVSAASARTASAPALITNTAVLPTAATFTVTGLASATYAITLPVGVTTISNGTQTMTVDTWLSNPTPTGALDLTGNQTLTVGATLHVGAAQAVGTYTSTLGSGDFTVTVNYN
jgi:hypothetical protein